jgi:hypothetical protein
MLTVTLLAGEFDSNSNSQADTDSSEDRFLGYIPPVPEVMICVSSCASMERTCALSAPTLCTGGAS